MKGYIDQYLDYIFFVSEKGKELYLQIIEKYYAGKRDKQRYIVNRLGVEDFENSGHYSNDGVFRILSCSRMVPLKRVPMLAEVFSQWSGCKIEWTHIGNGDEFDIVKRIVNNESQNRDSECILLGNLPHEKVIEYYKNNKIDVFINISQYEGLPVAIMEALSFGVPIIATNAGGTAELVNEENGILLDTNVTKQTIDSAVRKIISLNHEEYLHMREKAYQRYCDLLDSNANFNELLKVVCVSTE